MSAAPKILVLHHSKTSGHRVEDYFAGWKKRGYVVEAQSPPKGYQKNLWLSQMKNYEVIYVHRLLFSWFHLRALRKKAGMLIFDFDDAIMHSSSRHKIKWSLSRSLKFKWMMQACDQIICGNSYLAGFAKKYTQKVKVIPTAIDCSFFHPKERDDKKTLSPLIVGWSGRGEAHLPFLELLKGPLEKCGQKHPVTLKVVGVKGSEKIRHLFSDLKYAKSSLIDWVDFEHMPAMIGSFHVGVMPLTDDEYAKGKCALKLLEYMAVGIAVICSPVGVNRDIIEHGVNGMLASTPEDWAQCLITLAADPSACERMGQAARDTVMSGFSTDVSNQLMAEIFVSLGL